jgi:hypothetical protein
MSDEAKQSHKCRECGEGTREGQWCDSVMVELVKRQLCHDCYYWHERIEQIEKSDPNIVVVEEPYNNGTFKEARTIYQLVPGQIWKTGRTEWNGFSGAVFTIQFDDGRQVTTNNLWYNGPVPDRFLDRIPANAKFGETP